MAGLSRPMKIHNTNIQNSIDLNAIGTANITKVCAEKKYKIDLFFNKLRLSRIKRRIIKSQIHISS